MNSIQINEIGELIRKKRREKELRLEDLADENISSATISNIERGIPYVNREKVYYVLSKLQLDPEDLPELLLGEQQSMERLKFQLDSIETLLEIHQREKALKRLKELDLPDSHPYAARVSYLVGKTHALTGKWRKSERKLSNAIRLDRLNESDPRTNLEACSYYELCQAAIRQNLLEKGLEYANLGLKAFDSEGERQQIKYFLQVGKAQILARLNRLGESLGIVQDLWPERSQIHPIRILIQLYLLRVWLLRKTGMLQQAREYAVEGLEIARLNQDHEGSFELWIALGCVHQTGQNWVEAEACLELALQLEDSVKNRECQLRLYNRLGLLYLHQGKWRQAEEVMEKAIRLKTENKNSPHLVEAFTRAGDLHRRSGKTEKALQRYEQALELSRKHRFRKREKEILFRLAQCHEKKDPQSFLRYMEEMYQVQKETDPGLDP